MTLLAADPEEVRASLDRIRTLRRELERLQHAHPLAFARLWVPECLRCPHPSILEGPWRRGRPLRRVGGMLHECPDCGERTQRTSQRAAIADMLEAHDARMLMVLGGNRTGKSEGVIGQLATAYTLGRGDPAVQRWARINELDVSRIQEGPGRVWVDALTFHDAREYVRPKLRRYLPDGTAYRSWLADNEAEARTPEGGIVISKAVRQGRDGHQGSAIHAGFFDEEPGDPGVVQEVEWRLIDHRGPAVFSMTPLRGWTPFLTRHLRWQQRGEPCPSSMVVRWLHGEDNPHVDASEIRRRAARLPEAVKRARLRGEITALEGRVHKAFDVSVHVIESRPVPDEWPRFGAIDFGTRAPFCHLWAALDPSDDVLHVYACHYRAGWRTALHARELWEREACRACMPEDIGTEPWWQWRFDCNEGRNRCGECEGTGRTMPEIEIRWADPEGLDARATLNRDYDIGTVPAAKSRRVGWEAIEDRLALDEEGRPHLLIHDCCADLIRELQNLTWKREEPGPKERSELEVKGDDHAWDTLRYLCLGLRRSGYGHYEDGPEIAED